MIKSSEVHIVLDYNSRKYEHMYDVYYSKNDVEEKTRLYSGTSQFGTKLAQRGEAIDDGNGILFHVENKSIYLDYEEVEILMSLMLNVYNEDIELRNYYVTRKLEKK